MGYMPNLSAWVTKPQAAERLQASVKTIERLVMRGQLKQRARVEANQKEVAVYNPVELDRIAAKRGASVAAGPVAVADVPKPVEAAKAAVRPGVPIPKKLWLSVREAAEYSGLPKAFLRGAVRTGVFPAAHKFGGSWRLSRLMLEVWNPISNDVNFAQLQLGPLQITAGPGPKE
jgi:excisionase family DNA binding protein